MAVQIASPQSSAGFAITPNDSADISADAAAIALGMSFCYVHIAGTSGLVKVDTVDGSTISLYGTQGTILGTTLPLKVRRVYATGTAATSLVALKGKIPFN